MEQEPAKPLSATSLSWARLAVCLCLRQRRLSSRGHESTGPLYGSSVGDSGAPPTSGGLSERSSALRYFLAVGSETPVSRAIEATLAPPLPSLLISSILSTPIVSFPAPFCRIPKQRQGKADGTVGAPMLKPESFSCSFP